MRHLTPAEITRLESNGCRCRDWSRVSLRCQDFNPDNYADVSFSGDITLGGHDSATDSAIFPPVSHVRLHDCELGRNVTIQDVHRITGYIIADNATITGCGTISATSTTANGITVNVLDETGSKALRAFHGLTAQIARMAIADDGLRTLINALELPPAHQAGKPIIESGATLEGASLITDTIIGEGAAIGHNAILENSIVESGARIGNGTHISNCFAGQGITLSGFTAQHSLFFANTHLCNGEAASVFAGPFTVSEHKSTLLIGGEFMMFNAGSGTNQSNHLYKLGPIHHGSMGRGSKCASDSYIMWPARIGDFTMVSGRHYSHPDTRLFPFSYLIAEPDGRSRLLPGVNLCKCGTARDIAKWPRRDHRAETGRLDIISYAALNPASIIQIRRALKFLSEHNSSTHPRTKNFLVNGVLISPASADKATGYYANALMRYFGEKLLYATEKKITASLLRANTSTEWTDLAGYVMPASILRDIAARLRNNEITTTRELADAFGASSRETAAMEAAFALKLGVPEICLTKYGVEPGHTQNAGLLRAYVKAEEEYLTMVLADAAKEAKMAERPALANDDPTLNALKKRLIDIKNRVARLTGC